MTNLTEQWKKGELPIGEYYLLYKDGTTDREYYDWANVYGCVTEKGFSTYPNDIEKILAPVPSYEEWQASQKWIKHLEEIIKIYERKDKQATETSIAYNELVEENTKLKEILKKTKTNGHYPDRISRLKSRVVALSEENIKLKTENKWYSEQLNEAVKQYDNLKELLKECKPFIELCNYTPENKRLLERIVEQIGDK